MRKRLIAALCGALLLAGGGHVASAQERAVPESQGQVLLSYGPVVKRAAPAVVNIYTKRVIEQRLGSRLFDDPFFKRFFGDSFGDFAPRQRREQSSLGSGVIVDPDGVIVTNHHVIEGADEISVVLADRREFDATLILDDATTDLAILKIEPQNESLPFLEFRDSDSVEVGDLVLAIGNPFGVGQTVTSGIVSALARTQVGVSDYSFFIQTDAAINPGNSGGALVTLDGMLIGINTAIYSRSGGSIGIGFAIPSNMVRSVVASVGSDRVVRAWAGLKGQTLTPDLASGFGLDIPSGILVSDLYPDGPADRAGLERGDVVLAVAGQEVLDVKSFNYRVATQELGAEADLDVWRDGARLSLMLPLETAPETPPADPQLLEGEHPLGGATVENLSPALSERLDLPGLWEGVIITRIERGAPARRVGFRPGDLILSINGESIESSAGLADVMRRTDEPWKISMSRGGQVRSVTFGR